MADGEVWSFAVPAQHRVRGELDDVHLVAQASEDPAQRVQERRGPWPVQGQRDFPATERERLQEARQAEEVVGVEVGQEDLLQSTRPTSERSSCRCVPSPQSKSSRSPPRRTSVAEGARLAVGIEPAVPRKITSRSTP